ncbi:DUF167 family protein [Roseospira visakhapatnamensis]|uniref:UPF0235 protein GGD89_002205 n=1 Tax=Roseospira visakhapatnamensis TaxID=390880 RepID=A0A7W6RDN2_9PROT|nr:hypothetical protein [Roseospira visakhapatnamensis]
MSDAGQTAAPPPLPLVPRDDGARLSVRLTPKAARDRIEGVATDADGRPWLRVSVTAVPEGGKANAALVALLAKTWRLPRGAFTVVSGATDRRKSLRVAASSETLDALAERLAALPRR